MPSFDIVSEVDMHEVRNAVEQAQREVSTRYDLKDSGVEIELDAGEIKIVSPNEMALEAAVELTRQKLAKRKVSLKSVIMEDVEKIGGDMRRQILKLRQSLQTEELKKIVKQVKSGKFKVQTQIQGSQVRIIGKKRDDLQTVIRYLREEMREFELQFVNMRD